MTWAGETIVFVLNHFASAMSYLNQVTHLENGGGHYVIHNWSANPNHIDNKLHKHSFFEVCYVVSGEGVYLDADSEFRLQRGDLFCSRPNVWHRIYHCRSLYLLWVSFEWNEGASAEHALELNRALQHVERYLIRNAESLPSVLIWQSILMQAEKLNGLETIVKPLADVFIAALIGTFLTPPEPEHTANVHNDPRRLLHQAKTFVQDNLSQPLQLKHVADYLHVSERNLSRLFHDYGTETFIQYLKAERIRKAAGLLARSTISIKDIASECGFESVHYMTRMFTVHFGMPPGKYRSTIRG